MKHCNLGLGDKFKIFELPKQKRGCLLEKALIKLVLLLILKIIRKTSSVLKLSMFHLFFMLCHKFFGIFHRKSFFEHQGFFCVASSLEKFEFKQKGIPRMTKNKPENLLNKICLQTVSRPVEQVHYFWRLGRGCRLQSPFGAKPLQTIDLMVNY